MIEVIGLFYDNKKRNTTIFSFKNEDVTGFVSINSIGVARKCKWGKIRHDWQKSINHILEKSGYTEDDFSKLNYMYLLTSKKKDKNGWAKYLVTPKHESYRKCELLINSDGGDVSQLVHELRYNVDIVNDVHNAKKDFDTLIK